MSIRRFAIVLIPFLAGGCTVSVLRDDGEYDSQTAQETLIEALDAWKDGDLKLLVKLDSPIRFVDDDLYAGFQLVDYELTQPDRPVRKFQSVPVTLTLRKGRGEPITRPAEYQISLDPDRAVLRSDP